MFTTALAVVVRVRSTLQASFKPCPVGGGCIGRSFGSLGDFQRDPLQRRLERYAAFHRSLRLPKPSSFVALGHTFTLPLLPGHLPRDNAVTQAMNLQYLAGFFDGDGTVTVLSNLSGCRLVVGQSIANASVLVRFLTRFGGRIDVQQRGYGACNAVLSWRVGGFQARGAACALASETSVKREQLEIAASWPTCKLERNKLQCELRRLKSIDFVQKFVVTWHYLAGFFDAEGHIRVSHSWASFTLTITQKYVAILERIRTFLVSHCPEANVSIYEANRSSHRLVITNTDGSRRILERLLDAGLIQKRQQAKIALTLGRENQDHVREVLFGLTGNQCRYLRHDVVGRRMVLDIMQHRRQLANIRAESTKIEKLRAALEAKVTNLEMHRQKSRIALYRRDIRALLLRGARRP